MSNALEDPKNQQKNYHAKRVEMLNKAIDGAKRYNLDPLFREVIEALVQDKSEWDIIEKLLEMNISLKDKIHSLLEQWPGGQIA